MNGLKKEIAVITNAQWMVLILLSLSVNLIVVVGVVMLLAPSNLPQLLAQGSILPTRTSFPTFTATPTSTSFATSESTKVPTWTPTITPTPLPTETPTNVPTRVFVQPAAIALPSATLTPTPQYDYIGTVRQMTACENQGKHHIFAYVRDQAGNGIPGINMRVFWPGGDASLTTGTKIEDPGLSDFAMFKGSYYIEVLDGLSQVVGPISPDIPLNEVCNENGNTQANSLYHYSFEVVFTKAR